MANSTWSTVAWRTAAGVGADNAKRASARRLASLVAAVQVREVVEDLAEDHAQHLDPGLVVPAPAAQ
ncbi:hypothetical protein [Streptomyces tendae]